MQKIQVNLKGHGFCDDDLTRLSSLICITRKCLLKRVNPILTRPKKVRVRDLEHSF